MIDESQLNEYSRPIATALFAAMPELRPLARIDPGKEVDPGSLLIEWPRSAGPSADGLWISTDNGEISVGFDWFHTHIGLFDEGDDETAKAIEFIRDILEERVVTVAHLRGQEWAGSTLAKPGERPDKGNGQDVRLRSWRGTYDADY